MPKGIAAHRSVAAHSALIASGNRPTIEFSAGTGPFDEALRSDPAMLLEQLLTDRGFLTEGVRKPNTYSTWKNRLMSTDDRQLLVQSSQKFGRLKQSLWESEGGCAGVKDFVTAMREHGASSSGATLGNMVREQLSQARVVGYKEGAGSKSPWRVPLWQIDPHTGGILPGIVELCDLFGSNGFAVQNFVVAARLRETDQRPLDLLREGRVRRVLELAHAYDNQLN